MALRPKIRTEWPAWLLLSMVPLFALAMDAGCFAGEPALSIVKVEQRTASEASASNAQSEGKGMVLPSNLVAGSNLQRFLPDTLYEIINGDADLYLKAGFVRLETRRFLLKDDSRQWIDFYAYQMNRHRSAFAVFSVRRDREAVPFALTRFAYRYQNGLFFVHGPYYVEILAGEETVTMVDAMHRLGAAFIDFNEVEAEPIPELGLFPPEDLIPDSIALHPSGAFGFEAFNDVFTARYRVNRSQATAFFRLCRSPEAAARLAFEYQAFLMEYDGVAAPENNSLPNSRLIQILDTYTLVFTHGNTVAGVQDARTPDQAEMLAMRLKAGLSSF